MHVLKGKCASHIARCASHIDKCATHIVKCEPKPFRNLFKTFQKLSQSLMKSCPGYLGRGQKGSPKEARSGRDGAERPSSCAM